MATTKSTPKSQAPAEVEAEPVKVLDEADIVEPEAPAADDKGAKYGKTFTMLAREYVEPFDHARNENAIRREVQQLGGRVKSVKFLGVAPAPGEDKLRDSKRSVILSYVATVASA
jgi:hypothetical protein